MLTSVRAGSRRLQQQARAATSVRAGSRRLQQQARAALGTRALATAVPDVHLPDGGATLPSHARCVIVGGGVIGLSTAYHLAKHGGWKEVLLLEQSRLTSGTTWHAAGLVGTSRPTATETRLSIEGTRLYDGVLEEETGVATGYKACGSLTVARTPERLHALKRAAAKARSFGLGAEMVTPQQCADHWNNVLTPDGLVGGLWLPGDGSASPTDLSMSFAAGARMHGVRIVEGVRVEGFEAAAVEGGGGGRRRVRAVTTQGGQRVAADTVVLCGGQWTRQVAATAGVSVPLHSCEHFYVITEPIPGVHGMLPVMRDPDVRTYFREWGGGLCAGGFEDTAKPIWTGGVPKDFSFGLLPDDWDQFMPLYEGAVQRVPALADAGVQSFFNGPESFTTDNQYCLGEAPELAGMFVAAGFNSSGIASAGGAGKALAEWVAAGEPTMELGAVDIRRFGSFFTNGSFLRDRVAETLGLHYAMPWPRRELESSRGLRHSPLYGRLDAAGAVWGQKYGWERANYYAPPGREPRPEPVYSFGRPGWFDYVAAEHRHCRAHAALFDVTSFAKILVSGRDAEAAVQRLCAADMAVAVGRVVYTAMLNARGTFESDCTVTRLSATEFLVVSPTAQATRDLDWINRGLDAMNDGDGGAGAGGDGNNNSGGVFAVATDVTNGTAVLALMGPRARDVLAAAGGEGPVGGAGAAATLSNEAFPFGTARSIDVGPVVCRAARITYVGELGWELYVPAEMAHAAYDALHAAAATLGEVPLEGGAAGERGSVLRDCGYYAIDSLRVEKGYRAFGHELDARVTPLETGLGFAADLDGAAGFVGKDALLAQRAAGALPSRVATLVLAAEHSEGMLLWGDEPVYCDGELAGTVTSTNYGHTVGATVCLASVRHPEVSSKGFFGRHEFEVELAGERLPCRATVQCAYDPKGVAIKQ